MDGAIARGSVAATAARDHYRDLFRPLVKASGVLGSNTRTLAAFASMMLGGPLDFFLFESVALNLFLIAVVMRRATFNRRLAGDLSDANANCG